MLSSVFSSVNRTQLCEQGAKLCGEDAELHEQGTY
jgi:hypothetical protein